MWSKIFYLTYKVSGTVLPTKNIPSSFFRLVKIFRLVNCISMMSSEKNIPTSFPLSRIVWLSPSDPRKTNQRYLEDRSPFWPDKPLDGWRNVYHIQCGKTKPDQTTLDQVLQSRFVTGGHLEQIVYTNVNYCLEVLRALSITILVSPQVLSFAPLKSYRVFRKLSR